MLMRTLWNQRWAVLGLFIASGAVALVLWFGFLRGICFGRTLLSLPLGTPRETIKKAMGTPSAIEGRFRLAQERLYEAEYAEAAQSGASEFWVWEYWLDTVCCAGFNADGLLVVRHCGTT